MNFEYDHNDFNTFDFDRINSPVLSHWSQGDHQALEAENDCEIFSFSSRSLENELSSSHDLDLFCFPEKQEKNLEVEVPAHLSRQDSDSRKGSLVDETRSVFDFGGLLPKESRKSARTAASSTMDVKKAIKRLKTPKSHCPKKQKKPKKCQKRPPEAPRPAPPNRRFLT